MTSQSRRQHPCPYSIIQAFKNEHFTDLMITCGPKVFLVHQVVVCSACDFFRKSVEFKGKEAEEKRIDLPEDDPDMIGRLIAYLYTGNYDPCGDTAVANFERWDIPQLKAHGAAAMFPHPRTLPGEVSEECACLVPGSKDPQSPTFATQNESYTLSKIRGYQILNPLTVHATMYTIGHKYQVPGLCPLSKRKFLSCIPRHANSEDFVEAVQIAYSSTPDHDRMLRDAIVEAFQTSFNVNLADMPGIEAKLDTIDELSLQLIMSWPSAKSNTNSVPVANSRDPTIPLKPVWPRSKGSNRRGNISNQGRPENPYPYIERYDRPDPPLRASASQQATRKFAKARSPRTSSSTLSSSIPSSSAPSASTSSTSTSSTSTSSTSTSSTSTPSTSTPSTSTPSTSTSSTSSDPIPSITTMLERLEASMREYST